MSNSYTPLKKLIPIFLFFGLFSQNLSASMPSVARQWNEAILFSIRGDFSRPTIHARNLYHTSIAMYDAWAAYDTTAATFFLGKTHGNYFCPFNGLPQVADVQAAREKAMSYACYRLLRQRFQFTPGAAQSLVYYDSLMTQFGYPTNNFSQDYSSGDPAALGNYLAARIMEYGLQDGSNQSGNYANQYYETINPEIIVNNPGNTTLVDPNRWQAIFLEGFVDQSGNLISISPPFLSPEWGNVVPFSMDESQITTYERDGDTYKVYMDCGAPPFIDTTAYADLSDPYKRGFMMVSVWQSFLDPSDGVMWDISPASIGNNTALPDSPEDFPGFYDFFQGGDHSMGWTENPVTGQPYEPQLVPRGDYARVLAEFWADGPSSETPPGHWFTILNYVSDHPLHEKRWNGQGPILDDLEWDVRSYFTLGGAMHDAAIAAWSIKGWYDYPRPVSIIRWMAEKGQATDPFQPRYHPAGVPLIPGLVELVMPGDSLAGENDENLYKVKLYTWKGHAYIADPLVDEAGVGWILAENWWPYQRPNFVTPPFAGYISGHSTYSRTAAEVMELITGNAYFPGGMGEFLAPMNEFLKFEEGPSMDIVLQWATYKDASDQCSLSRIFGGIHPPQDDIPGRKIGIVLGPQAFDYAVSIMDAGLPYVTSVNYSTPLVTDQEVANDLIVTVSFNENMNTAVAPEISFPDDNLGQTFSAQTFTWIDSRTCEVSVSILDGNLETMNQDVIISAAQDEAGNEQRTYFEANVIDVDTRNPLVVQSSINYTIVNQALAGVSMLEITVNFDEAMDVNTSLEVSFTSPIPVMSFTEVNAGVWLDEFTFMKSYSILDIQEECPNVQVELLQAKDVHGNPQVPAEIEDLLNIDTKQPLVSFIASNTYFVDETFAQAGDAIQFQLIYDELMDVSTEPTISFEGSSFIENILVNDASASSWINPYTYLATYDVNVLPLNIYDINVLVNDAKDLYGNIMAESSYDSYMDIELNTTGINDLAYTDASSIGPNPVIRGTSSQLKAIDHGSSISIVVMDEAGRIIKTIDTPFSQNKNIEIETSDLSAGYYTVHLRSEKRTEMIRLVVVQ